MFYNKSNLGSYSGLFTKEIFYTLTEFNDLNLVSDQGMSDAVLIGVLESSEMRKDSIRTHGSQSVEEHFGADVIGENRNQFTVPRANEIKMSLRIIVIKHPTKSEIEFLQTGLGASAISSKVIFNEKIPLSTVYNLKKYQGENISVLGTQNRGVYRESMKLLAKQAADNFRNMILYAF